MNINEALPAVDMTRHRHVRFEELISLTDAGDWLKGEYLYVCRGRKQISQIRLEGLQIPKNKKTTGQIGFVDFLIKDALREDTLEKEDIGRPLCLTHLGELALMLKREYSPDSNSFVWRGVHREERPVVFAGTDYRLTKDIGTVMIGLFEFYQIHPSYFRERKEAIRQCIEQYHAREARKADKTKSSSEPQP